MPDGVKTTVYLPDRVAGAVEALQAEERRSRNNMVVVLLEEALSRRRLLERWAAGEVGADERTDEA